MSAFKLNIADLVFVLKQIKIAEAHSSGTPLTQIYVDALGNVVSSTTPGATLAIPSSIAPFGLRTVDGSFNNIIPGRELWGAADQAMPRLLPSYYRNEGDDPSFFGVSNNNYAVNRDPVDGIPSGSVVDADPRLISNLVSDMSFNNPAAIVAALTFNGVEAIYGPGGALETIQTAFAALRVVIDLPPVAPVVPPGDPTNPAYLTALAAYNVALAAYNQEVADANVAFDAVLANYGVEHNGASISIPNVAPDEGLSAPFNAWMTFFGQFFDHGLDLINKGGNGTVYVPLNPDDPLMTHGADGIAGNADDLSRPENSNLRFMALTRATPSGDTESNQTTPFVDQNQTYTSNASHQVFLREYKLVDTDGVGPLAARPLATGHLLDGTDPNDVASTVGGSLPTWADVKAQALNVLGIRLTDLDVGNIPVLRVDQYGEFIRGPNGLPQLLTIVGNVSVWVEGNLGNPVDPSVIGAARTGHAFMDDIAHTAVPGTVFDHDNNPATAPISVQADSDNIVGNSIGTDSQGRKVAYDNDLLDQHYITGDGRGNENIGLTAVHHIFHSEHNRQVEQQKLTVLSSGDVAFINEWLAVDLVVGAGATQITQGELNALKTMTLPQLQAFATAENLQWDGERLFQAARMATEMQYQHLVFEEFARKIQPNIDPFVFNSTPDINPAIFAEFAHVVYRFGHSMLTDNMPRLDDAGAEMPAMNAHGEPLTAEQFGLVASFLNPIAFDNNSLLTDDQGAGAIIRGMTIERGNEIDEFLVDALRNNLLGLPLDLGAINIARGRDTGMPSLNQARQALFDASGSTFLKPYDNWIDFAANLKNPVSVINFIAAYGTHVSITSATTASEKRDAAWLLVMGDGNNLDGVTIRGVTYSAADRTAFLAATGAYTNKGGLNEIDLWIGGLAEKKMPFGGFLGSTFNAVFELQLENLQDGDRFYYLTRTQGQNFLVSLEQNSFAKLIMANTDLAQPGADGIRGTPDDVIARHMGVDSFAVYDHVLEVNIANQADYTPVTQAEEDAANAAIASAQLVYNNAVAAKILAADVADDFVYATEQAEYLLAKAAADGQDATGELAALIAAATAVPPDFDLGVLQAAITAYQNAVSADALADAAAATALSEAVNALAADNALAAAVLAEDAALLALQGAQADLAALIAGGAGKDPVGNNPILEAVGLGKVIRDDPTTAVVETNYIRVQGGEHTAVGGTNGNDTIITDFGDDGIWGDAGDDRIESGAGVDLVNGGSGNDIITDSGDTGDFLKGDEGDDVISGGNGLDIYMGGEGKDVVFHGVDDAETFAGQGDDFVLGGLGVDLIMGNEGDDWLEGGAGFDTTAGDNSELFFDSKIIGHDVMFSGSEEHDFDAESGDDIMVQGESVLRSEGMFGFDWATYDGNAQNADVDLARPIFTTEVQDVLRDRFDKVEAASGFTGNDLLVGDDRVFDANALGTIVAAAGGAFQRDDINAAGIARIDGLNQIITTNQMRLGTYTAEFGDLYNPTAPQELIFGFGNVLIGGAGNDVLVGKGGDDILDGDRWLNVRIRFTQPGQANTAANQIATIDSLDHVFTTQTAGANTAWVGKSLAQLLLDRTIVPNQMHIVREILDGDAANTAVDTAAFWDVRENYTFTVAGNGTYVVSHTGFGNTPISQAMLDAGFRNISDGVDTLRNIEALRFGTQTFTLREIFNSAPTGNFVITGQPAREGSTLTAPVIQDANGINLATRTIQWQSSIDGLSWSNISGANGTQFTPPNVPGMQVSPFAANLFRVIISYTDNAGFDEQVVTVPTTTPMGIVWSAAGSGTGVTFTAFAGPDNLTGSGSADTLDGAAGNDSISGGGGNDIITGGAGDDSIDGGAGGGDVAVFAGPVASYEYDTTLLGFGSDPVITDTVGNGGTDTLDNVEILRIAGVDYTIVTGTFFSDGALNGVNGANGSQIVFARTGNDTLNGGAASDILVGSSGNDTLVGGADNDFVFGGAGTDTIRQGSTEGRDFIDGGAGTDTYILTGVAGVTETFNIYARAAAVTAGFGAGLDADTEIVITRAVGAGPATVIAELDNIEEITVNALQTTAQNGNGVVDGGTDGSGDTIAVFGNFAAPNTSLLYNTITINGSNANDTVDISGLESDHRIVFTTNGGNDTLVGPVRTQDTIVGSVNDPQTTGGADFGAQDGLGAMVGGDVRAELRPSLADVEMSRGRTMIEIDDLLPLDLADMGQGMPVHLFYAPIELGDGDHRSVITDYPV